MSTTMDSSAENTLLGAEDIIHRMPKDLVGEEVNNYMDGCRFYQRICGILNDLPGKWPRVMLTFPYKDRKSGERKSLTMPMKTDSLETKTWLNALRSNLEDMLTNQDGKAKDIGRFFTELAEKENISSSKIRYFTQREESMPPEDVVTAMELVNSINGLLLSYNTKSIKDSPGIVPLLKRAAFDPEYKYTKEFVAGYNPKVPDEMDWWDATRIQLVNLIEKWEGSATLGDNWKNVEKIKYYLDSIALTAKSDE